MTCRWALDTAGRGSSTVFLSIFPGPLFHSLGEGAETGTGTSVPCSRACVQAASCASVAETWQSCWKAGSGQEQMWLPPPFRCPTVSFPPGRAGPQHPHPAALPLEAESVASQSGSTATWPCDTGPVPRPSADNNPIISTTCCSSNSYHEPGAACFI